MPSKPVTSALGLYRTPNPLGGAQDGGYRELKNCVIPSRDVVQPRLGHSRLNLWLGSNKNDSRRINALFDSSIGALAQYGSGTTSGVALLETLGTAILSDVDPPSAWLRTKFADCMKRCYFTSDSGLKRIDSTPTGAAAGGPRPVACVGHNAQFTYDSSGFLAADSACMYRAELVDFAPDGAEVVGPPSARVYIRASSNKTTGATGVVRATNVITVTTTAAHGFKVGQTVNAAFDAADTGANEFTNGLKTILAVTSATQFKVAETAADYTSTVASTWSAGPASLSSLKVFLPSGVSTSTVIRLYRSEQVTPATGTPSDDVYKVYEAKLTSTHVSNGFLTLSDNTPEVLLGDPSYFSPSVEGEGGANETPPLMHDVCSIGDQLYGFNLLDPHRLELRLISTGGSVGIVENTTLTFTRGAVNFTCTAETTSFLSGNGEFVTYTGGTVSRDIEATALSLCDAINGHSSNTFLRAEYVSLPSDAPGSILLTAEDFSTTPFTVTSDKGQAWAPYILNTGTATSSQQVPDYAGICWSKNGQPDAWPGLQRGRVGSPSEYALRGLALRDKIVCLKERSAHLITPTGAAVRIDPLDDSCEFPLPDTAAVLDNQAFALSSIGVVSISEGGLANMGTPIDGDLRSVIEQALSVRTALVSYSTIVPLASWGVADELERRYLLAVPSTVLAAGNGQSNEVDSVWVYNTVSRAWSGPWPLKYRHASPRSASGRFIFARHDAPGVMQEQGWASAPAVRHSDYFGETLYVENLTGDQLGLVAVATGANTSGTLEVGDALYVSATGFYSVVTAIGEYIYDPDSQVQGDETTYPRGVTVADGSGFAASTTVQVLKRIPVRVEPVMLSQDAFPQGKQVTGFNLALAEARFRTATVYMGSERSGDRTAKTLSRPGFGSAAFGSVPFGDGPGLVKERGQAPKGAARGDFHSLALVVEEAGAFFKLYSFALDFEVGSPKGVR